jgi:hypothetical protein
MMNEHQIIQQMMAMYANCRSYQDQGQLETITDPNTTAERRERLAFRTAFVRPMFFRFEWRKFDEYSGKPQESESVWCDGRTAYSRNRFEEGVQEYDTLDHAIAGATGVSAHIVSSLLMPDILSFRFMRHGSLSSMQNENLHGEQCYHLVATTPEQRTDILTSCTSYALRRIREERIFKGGNISLPPMPPGISAEEREEMVKVLTESAEDLHTISDCSYYTVAFDAQIPQSLFQLPV